MKKTSKVKILMGWRVKHKDRYLRAAGPVWTRNRKNAHLFLNRTLAKLVAGYDFKVIKVVKKRKNIWGVK
jgi:hypothetical protein